MSDMSDIDMDRVTNNIEQSNSGSMIGPVVIVICFLIIIGLFGFFYWFYTKKTKIIKEEETSLNDKLTSFNRDKETYKKGIDKLNEDNKKLIADKKVFEETQSKLETDKKVFEETQNKLQKEKQFIEQEMANIEKRKNEFNNYVAQETELLKKTCNNKQDDRKGVRQEVGQKVGHEPDLDSLFG